MEVSLMKSFTLMVVLCAALVFGLPLNEEKDEVKKANILIARYYLAVSHQCVTAS